MEDKTKKALIEIVGAENYSDQIIDRVTYSYDASEAWSRPDCAIWPRCTDHVSRILAIANREGIPVVSRGAGTGLSGHTVPVKGGIILDFLRMNKILSIRVPDRLAVVQPGVVYDDFQSALRPHGFFFPPDPASGRICTLGGNVGTNAGGLRAAKYGTTRDYVLGLEVVLADGDVMRTGASTMKCSSGYDITRLIVGSEGTLGAVTEITFKIAPLPKEVATATATFDRLDDAGEAVTLIMHSGVIPSVLELIDANTVAMYRKYTDLQLPPVEAMVLVETDGCTKEEVNYQLDRVIEVFRKCNAGEIERAKSEAEAERLWLARKSIGGMMGMVTPNRSSEDITVPMSRIVDFLRGMQEISKKHDLLILNFGHAGDGNLHPNIMYDRSDPDQIVRLERVELELHQLACDLGGTLTGEHGIGITKAAYMSLEHDKVALRVMRSLKKTLDPNNILNPGKMALEA